MVSELIIGLNLLCQWLNSVVIITYNEEKNISRCLESVKDIADEILVVDSFSEDRTREICSEYGAKVLKHHFTGHIEQKNWAFSHTSFHHVLSIDADEVVSDTLKRSIIKKSKTGPMMVIISTV